MRNFNTASGCSINEKAIGEAWQWHMEVSESALKSTAEEMKIQDAKK